MSRVYSDFFKIFFKFLISGLGLELEPQSQSKLGSGSRIVACQGMGVGWEVSEYEFAWTNVALLTPGGCTLGLSHCPASAVLLRSWARLNWFSTVSMLLSASMGLSLQFLLFCEGASLVWEEKATPPPPETWHVLHSATDVLCLTLDKWSPVVESAMPFSILTARRQTVAGTFILKRGLQEGLLHSRKHSLTVKTLGLEIPYYSSSGWLLAVIWEWGGRQRGSLSWGSGPQKTSFPSLTQSHWPPQQAHSASKFTHFPTIRAPGGAIRDPPRRERHVSPLERGVLSKSASSTGTKVWRSISDHPAVPSTRLTLVFFLLLSVVLGFSKSWQGDSASFVPDLLQWGNQRKGLGLRLSAVTNHSSPACRGPACLSLLLCLAHIKKMNYSLVPLQKSILCGTFQYSEQRMGYCEG